MSILTTRKEDLSRQIPISTKQPKRGDPEQLRRDTEAFLANDGVIKVYPQGATGTDPLDKDLWKTFAVKRK